MSDPEPAAPETRPRFVWAMGLTNAAYGFGFSVVLVTMPQIMAAAGVGEPTIAAITGLATFASLFTFALAPILDTMISRRAWATLLGCTAAALAAGVFALSPLDTLVPPLMMALGLVLVMLTTALGGWLGAALPKDMDETIGTWFVVGNGAGFGLGALTQFWIVTHLAKPLAVLVIAAGVLLPLALTLLIPSPDTGRKAVRESFGDLARDLRVLVQKPHVLRICAMFVMPCAAFTLTNAFGGLGADFHVSSGMVGVANGVGATVTGVIASLLARQVLKLVPAPMLYLATGVVGAAFTTLIIALPHGPTIYLAAVIGENIAQSFAQVAQNAIQFGSIRRGSPIAASQFGLLLTAALVPYSYMQALDGYGYKLAGNVAGSFWMDAGVSLAACALIALPVIGWMRRGQLTEPDADIPEEAPKEATA